VLPHAGDLLRARRVFTPDYTARNPREFPAETASSMMDFRADVVVANIASLLYVLLVR
jgi:hypothetical protein